MTRFTFIRGTWKDGGIDLPEWNEDEEHQEYLKRIGYDSYKTTFGNEGDNSLEIYRSLKGNSFYASICPLTDEKLFEVFLPDFPSLMMFLKNYAGVFLLLSMNDKQLEIQSILEKMFQVQHGHSSGQPH